MIETKPKKCKGINKAKNFEGCNEIKYIHKYGLCKACFYKFLLNTTEGKQIIKDTTIKAKKQVKIERKKQNKKDKDNLKTDFQKKNEKKRLADTYFSQYIRLLYSYEVNGTLFCKCVTCGVEKPILKVDNGHYISRKHLSTRFDENNCRPQCRYCNDHGKGEPQKYREYLINEIGLKEVEYLEDKTREGTDTFEFYNNLVIKYRGLKKELQKNKGVKIW